MFRHLLRLFQLTRGGNMSGCLAQLFQKPYGSFNRGLPPKKPVSNTSPNAAGRMASCVRDVENGPGQSCIIRKRR